MMATSDFQIIIPARAGSKRIPNKNLVTLAGLPLISHSIAYALKYFTPAQIWVNSDSKMILTIAREQGVRTFQRPEHLGTDTVSTASVLQHQVSDLLERGIDCQNVVLLQATNPLRPENLMHTAIAKFRDSGRQSLATFSILNRKFGLIRDEHFLPENYTPGERMQDLVPRYYENGLLYITQAQTIMEGKVVSEDCYPLIVDHPFAEVDIDEPADLIKAEFYVKTLKNDNT